MLQISESVSANVQAPLSGWDAAWNAADKNAMWRLATDDVHWVNVEGQHWQGKADVQKAHQANFEFAEAADSFMHFMADGTHLCTLIPGDAYEHVRSTLRGSDRTAGHRASHRL
jgi:uncharacterized protein (TIGR02246 family)